VKALPAAHAPGGSDANCSISAISTGATTR
jgi:hypothetical protein